MGSEINRVRGDVAARYAQCIWHIEIELAAKDQFLNRFLLTGGEYRHLVASILPALGQFRRFGNVAINQGSAIFLCMRQRGKRGNRPMAKERGGLPARMEVAQDFAKIGVLHEIDDWRLTAGHEDARIAGKPAVDHRSQRPNVIHCGVVVEKGASALMSGFITVEMLCGVRHGIDMWLGPVWCRQHNFVARLNKSHDGHNGLVEILTGWAGPAALNFDAGGVRPDDKHFTLAHDILLNRSGKSLRSNFTKVVS